MGFSIRKIWYRKKVSDSVSFRFWVSPHTEPHPILLQVGGDPAPVVRWTRQGRESLPGTATVQPHQGLAITNLHPSDQVSKEELIQSLIFILVC